MIPIGRSRRRFLQALAAAAAGAPLARMLAGSIAHAEDGAVPKRLLLLYTPHGTSYPQWRPKPVGADDFDLAFPESILAPLAPYKSKLCVVEGLDMLSAYRYDESGHEGGMASLFTGGHRDAGGSLDTATDPSIDQLVADHLVAQGSAAPNRALDFVVGIDATSGGGTSAFFERVGDAIHPVSCESDTRAVFDRLFAGLTPDGPSPAQLAAVARKQRILDRSRAQVEALRQAAGMVERNKLDAHLAAIDELAARLDAGSVACSPPTVVGATDEWGNFDYSSESYPQTIAEFSDIVTQALACRLSPVVGMQMLFTTAYNSLPHLGIDYDTHNDLAHGAISEGAVVDAEPYRTDYLKMSTWWSEVFAGLLGRLDAIVEENGKTLLDNTIVVWANDMGNPSLHSNIDLPIVVAGGAGEIAMGRYLQYQFTDGDHNPHLGGVGTAPHNQLLVSICRAFGMDVDVVGDTNYPGPLPGF